MTEDRFPVKPKLDRVIEVSGEHQMRENESSWFFIDNVPSN
jgi:hypothetical protein